MGGFSIWHWLFVLAFLAGTLALCIWLIFRFAVRRSSPTPAARLQELAALKEQGLVSDAEYERKRRELLQQL